MESKSYHEDDIDRYLSQDMSLQERTAFEQRIKEDKVLQQEVALQQDIAAGIHLFGGESLKKQLQAVEDEGRVVSFPPKDQKKGGTNYLWLGIAASLSALLIVAILVFNRNEDPQTLYAAYYEPYPNVVNPAERSEGLPTDAAGQAMYYYEREEFEKAITLFTQESALDDQAYQFYLGVSYLGVQQAEEALTTLQPLLQDEQSAFYEPALWYTGLAQLQANQPEQAQEIFKKVVGLEGDYTVEAQALLDKL
ncbi:MAG: tetratricopeptide repeat protein [Cyclobacteriaceae bacterium]